VTAPLKTAEQPLWLLKNVCVVDIGTDPNAAMNFYNRKVDLTRTGLTAADLRNAALPAFEASKQRQLTYLNGQIAQVTARLAALRRAAGTRPPPEADGLDRQLAGLQQQLAAETGRVLAPIDPASVSAGAALSFLGTMIRLKAYEDQGITQEQQAVLDGFGTLDTPQVLAAYRPRPLAGLWATPPFLHNGSVPTLYHLLSPASERPATFLVGSRDFDPNHVGLVLPENGATNGATFDTSLPGNSNKGHEFNTGYVPWTPASPPQNGLIGPLLSPEDRLAIIEHLKIRNDDTDGPQTPSYPDWNTDCKLPTLATSRR
jgi:hypothetical protein